MTIEQATKDLDAIMARLQIAYPKTNATHLGASIVEWRSTLAATQRSVLLLLQGAVALVLLVACANVGNLFLAAAIRREHEFAVRAALGASRARRMRQVFLETAIVAAAAGALGLFVEMLAQRRADRAGAAGSRRALAAGTDATRACCCSRWPRP